MSQEQGLALQLPKWPFKVLFDRFTGALIGDKTKMFLLIRLLRCRINC